MRNARFMATRYEFDWDPAKALSNQKKHGVRFEDAMGIFTDKLALSLFDEEHSDNEDRWITLGDDGKGQLLVAIHTYIELGDNRVAIRIISARRPTNREVQFYLEGLGS